MVGRIFSIVKTIWARPAIQASFWLILESIILWLKDWIIVKLGTSSKPKSSRPRRRSQKTKVDTTSETPEVKPRRRRRTKTKTT